MKVCLRMSKVNWRYPIRVCVTFIILWVLPFLFGKYVDSWYPYIPESEIPQHLIGLLAPNNPDHPWCSPYPPLLMGKLLDTYAHAQQTEVSDEEAFAAMLQITPGGVWRPRHCKARYEVSLVVPYREREEQLSHFLRHMHPFLQKQLLYYRILVVEQQFAGPFNRAKLMNIGYLEGNKTGSPKHCFIFHDVDLLPQNAKNIYACTHHPRHMSSSIDSFRYHLPYRSLFGGVIAVMSKHFEKVNGFSNLYTGWGGEDDDFAARLQSVGLNVTRFDPSVAMYSMMPHAKQPPYENRFEQLQVNRKYWKSDGVNTLTYKCRVTLRPLYTHIEVV